MRVFDAAEPLRILIVEDEAIVLMQLEALIEDAGHIVVGSAMSAGEALEMIEEHRPELILLDLHLKDGSSGFDVMDAVRDADDVTVVFLTANILKLAEDLDGAAAVITKPFSQKALASSIEFLEECVHRPPPSTGLPHGMRLAPAFEARVGARQ